MNMGQCEALGRIGVAGGVMDYKIRASGADYGKLGCDKSEELESFSKEQKFCTNMRGLLDKTKRQFLLCTIYLKCSKQNLA